MTGQTYVDATVTDVMNAGVDFAAFAVTGLSDIHVMGLTMNGTNNLRAPVAAGSVEALGIGYGRFELTGTMDIYYESSAALAAYLAGTAVSLTLTLGSITGKKYTFSVPKIKFETGFLCYSN